VRLVKAWHDLDARCVRILTDDLKTYRIGYKWYGRKPGQEDPDFNKMEIINDGDALMLGSCILTSEQIESEFEIQWDWTKVKENYF
jgi:hypothetical protein